MSLRAAVRFLPFTHSHVHASFALAEPQRPSWGLGRLQAVALVPLARRFACIEPLLAVLYEVVELLTNED